ncbi:auxin-induced protein 22D-like [Ananas comosus]|uniref:Auxin-responsive protein n=2 Tax=Ananas comosus TaxID=4615 RepID=A0A6P5FE46_ANACO|nr:auxin-induced protein 22D-like [Ananas comosus]
MEGGRAGFVDDIDNLKATELRLGLPGTDDDDDNDKMEKTKLTVVAKSNKRSLPEADEAECQAEDRSEIDTKSTAPASKAQVVGWPPIRSYRKNSFQAMKSNSKEAEGNGMYVKVSMDGAPYLRKIDLKVYKGYKELREALEVMFKCFSHGMDGCNNNEFAIAYEDKDGDLMLAGDVPWEMFINSCKRLRIMKGHEARGLGSSP